MAGEGNLDSDGYGILHERDGIGKTSDDGTECCCDETVNCADDASCDWDICNGGVLPRLRITSTVINDPVSGCGAITIPTTLVTATEECNFGLHFVAGLGPCDFGLGGVWIDGGSGQFPGGDLTVAFDIVDDRWEMIVHLLCDTCDPAGIDVAFGQALFVADCGDDICPPANGWTRISSTNITSMNVNILY